MIRHVVLFRWSDDVTAAHIDAVSTALSGMPEAIDTIVSYRYGRNLGINPGTFDFAVTADFRDQQGYLTYRDHPAHQALIAAYITGYVTDRAAIQFELPG